MIRRISVFGLGKLGACMAATFAEAGFSVLGVDKHGEAVVRFLKEDTQWDESGMQELMEAWHTKMSATTEPAAAAYTDASFIIVPSPSLPDGSFSNEYILDALEPLAKAVKARGKRNHLFVVSSTTTPGACRDVIIPLLESILGAGEFRFCYNPEFIALGNVVAGLQEPDLVLIGELDKQSGDMLASVYERLNTNNPHVARMSTTSAELAKISVNSFVTMKISFTNQLRMICEGYGADVRDVLGAVGADSRIGKKFLRPGLAYGGPCFPRDNRLLGYAAARVGVTAALAEATDAINETSKEVLAANVWRAISRQGKALILGLAYRPGTKIVEESTGLFVARYLRSMGAEVMIHDFMAHKQHCRELAAFHFVETEEIEHLPDIGVIVICCEWPEYREIKLPKHRHLIDPWGIR